MDWVKSRNSRFCLQKWASFGSKSAVVRATFGKRKQKSKFAGKKTTKKKNVDLLPHLELMLLLLNLQLSIFDVTKDFTEKNPKDFSKYVSKNVSSF